MSSPNYTELQEKISQNLRGIEAGIAEACKRSGRSRDDVTIVAATKNVTPDAVKAAIECGIKVAGESRFQQAKEKIEVIGSAVEWHFIGHIQKNKVKFLTTVFSLVHSVDSFELAEAINRRAGTTGRKVQILLQINIGEEGSKHGVMPGKAGDVAEKISALPNIALEGLMAIPPQVADAQDSRKHFADMRAIKKEIEKMGLENVSMRYLSFGMSGDYEVAIEEGATHVRIGTAIFGKRDHAK